MNAAIPMPLRIGHVGAFQVHHQVVVAAARTNHIRHARSFVLGRQEYRDRRLMDIAHAVEAIGAGIPLFLRRDALRAGSAVGPELDLGRFEVDRVGVRARAPGR